jgi:hypothetical protein
MFPWLSLCTYVFQKKYTINLKKNQMPTQYSFTTHWQIKAPLPQVWNAIYQSLEWPQWWKGVVAVKAIEEGDENGIGGVREYTWRSILPYRLAFNMRVLQRTKNTDASKAKLPANWKERANGFLKRRTALLTFNTTGPFLSIKNG